MHDTVYKNQGRRILYNFAYCRKKFPIDEETLDFKRKKKTD